MTADDAKPILRTLRDVLLEARAFVVMRHEQAAALLLAPEVERYAELLERVDGAIAEADEVLA